MNRGIKLVCQESAEKKAHIYEIIHKLGGGAFGDVYKVRRGNRFFALKIMTRGKQEDMENAKKEFYFLRKINPRGQCKEHVVCGLYFFPIIYAQPHEDAMKHKLYGMLFKLIDGYDLHTLMQQKTIQKLSVQQVVKWAEDIFTALRDLHRVGVVHRDIKPANIMVRKTFKSAVLVDVGLACNLHGCSSLAGTYVYHAPEIQRAWDRGDWNSAELKWDKADVYSAALTFGHVFQQCGRTDECYKAIEVCKYIMITRPPAEECAAAFHNLIEDRPRKRAVRK
jgi:serine/threonine protein kinase